MFFRPACPIGFSGEREMDIMGKTDLRIIKTRRQIHQALLENLKENSFQKITVDMLCRSALINRSTFYKYYLDKYDLLDKFLGQVLDQFSQNINVEFVNASPSRIHDLCYIRNFESTLKFIAGRREEYQLLWNASIDRSVFDEMTGIIHHKIITAMKAQPFPDSRQEKYEDLYARLFASNMMSLILWWFQYYDTVSMADVEKIMTDNMHLGLFSTFKGLTARR